MVMIYLRNKDFVSFICGKVYGASENVSNHVKEGKSVTMIQSRAEVMKCLHVFRMCGFWIIKQYNVKISHYTLCFLTTAMSVSAHRNFQRLLKSTTSFQYCYTTEPIDCCRSVPMTLPYSQAECLCQNIIIKLILLSRGSHNTTF